MLTNNDEDALIGIEERINSMERRLRNARAARDAYLEHLKGKYPSWQPPTLPTYRYPRISSGPLINRLSTTDYQWDVEENKRDLQSYYKIIPRKENQINISSSGPLLLESDIRNTKRRLTEISQQLQSIRSTRMAMSTDDYMRLQPFVKLSHKYNSPDDDSMSRLESIRLRLSDITTNRPSPTVTPTLEEKEDIRMSEERERLVAEIRVGQRNWIKPEAQEKKDSETEVEEKTPQNSPHVHFANDTKVEETIQHETPIIIPTPQMESVEPQKSKDNSLTRMMNLFNQKTEDDSSDDSVDLSNTKPTPSNITRSSVTSNSPMNLLSQYLNKNTSDSEEEKPSMRSSNPTAITTKISAMYNDSDGDDFFD